MPSLRILAEESKERLAAKERLSFDLKLQRLEKELSSITVSSEKPLTKAEIVLKTREEFENKLCDIWDILLETKQKYPKPTLVNSLADLSSSFIKTILDLIKIIAKEADES